MTTATKSSILFDDALKTVGSVLIAVSLGLSGWCLHQITDHQSRLVRVETKTEEVYRVLAEIRADIKEIKAEVKRP